MTKREINKTLSEVNGLLTIARWHVQHNEFDQAIAQLEGANIHTLLAKARVEAYVEQQDSA